MRSAKRCNKPKYLAMSVINPVHTEIKGQMNDCFNTFEDHINPL